MKRNPRWSRLLGGLLVGAFSLTACSGQSSDEMDSSGDSLSVPDEVSGSAVIWSRSGDLFNVFDEAIQKFEQKYPDIEIDHQAVDIDAKLQNTLITGTDVPDGVFLDDAKIGAYRDFLWNVSDALGPYSSDILEQKIGVNTIDGKVYGIPFDSNPGLLFYNEAALTRAGVDPSEIVTYDDLIVAAEKYQAEVPEAKPIHLEQAPFLAQLQLDMYASQLGTALADQDGNVQLDSPEFEKILGFLNEVNEKGLGTRAEYLSPSDVGALDDELQVFYPWAIWFDFAPQQQLTKTKGNWRAMPLPAWEEGGPRSGAMGGSSFVLPREGKNSAAAFKFYEFLMFDADGYQTVWGPNSVYPNGLNTSIPAYKPALDAEKPLFKPFPEMGNQDLWGIAIEAASEIPEGTPIPAWWTGAVDFLGNNLQKMYDGDMTPQDVIAESSEEIQKNLIDRE